MCSTSNIEREEGGLNSPFPRVTVCSTSNIEREEGGLNSPFPCVTVCSTSNIEREEGGLGRFEFPFPTCYCVQYI